MDSKKALFRPKARLVSILGDQLIKDASVGLLELVKNGYDADASTVKVTLENINVPSETVIVVEDNGSGMTLEIVLNRWLVPATGDKIIAKKEVKRSKRNRLPLGEKGVGRFATHKIGKKLTLISRYRNEDGNLLDDEIVVNINWEDFENPDMFLDEVPIEYQIRSPQYFKDGSGTRLEMRETRKLWNEAELISISRTLRRLMNPFERVKDFEVSFVTGQFLRKEHKEVGCR